MFVFRRGEEEEPVAAVNPRIVESGDELETDDEGCLSLQGVLIPVERPATVVLEAQDVTGAPVRLELEGLDARVVQHELDHLDGVLILERTTPEARREAMATLRPQPDPRVRLGFAASAPFGADVLERLARNHEIAFVLTQPDAAAGRGRGLRPAPAKLKAMQLGLPVVESLDDPLDAETIVLVAYGRLIPSALLERHLWLNVHPSLLPRWRGAAPVERAIMAGDDGDRRHRDQAGGGARRRADRRAARLPGRRGRRRGLRPCRGGRRRAPRGGAAESDLHAPARATA